MKKYLLLVLSLSLIFSYSFGQDDMRKGVHYFSQASQLQESDALGVVAAGAALQNIDKGWRFTIVRIKADGNYVISFLHWPDGKLPAIVARNKALNASFYLNPATNSTVYFLLSVAEYNLSCKRLISSVSFTVGTATTIIKIRPGSKKLVAGKYPIYYDFANDFNLGLMFGMKYHPGHRENFAINLLAGIGISSVDIDSATTQGLQKTKTNSAATTFSVGLVFEIQKFQIGIFAGQDILSGETGRKFIYRNRPWIGLSLGYSIFQTKKATATDQP